jgi:hypothetical protein
MARIKYFIMEILLGRLMREIRYRRRRRELRKRDPFIY